MSYHNPSQILFPKSIPLSQLPTITSPPPTLSLPKLHDRVTYCSVQRPITTVFHPPIKQTKIISINRQLPMTHPYLLQTKDTRQKTNQSPIYIQSAQQNCNKKGICTVLGTILGLLLLASAVIGLIYMARSASERKNSSIGGQQEEYLNTIIPEKQSDKNLQIDQAQKDESIYQQQQKTLPNNQNEDITPIPVAPSPQYSTTPISVMPILVNLPGTISGGDTPNQQKPIEEQIKIERQTDEEQQLPSTQVSQIQQIPETTPTPINIPSQQVDRPLIQETSAKYKPAVKQIQPQSESPQAINPIILSPISPIQANSTSVTPLFDNLPETPQQSDITIAQPSKITPQTIQPQIIYPQIKIIDPKQQINQQNPTEIPIIQTTQPLVIQPTISQPLDPDSSPITQKKGGSEISPQQLSNQADPLAVQPNYQNDSEVGSDQVDPLLVQSQSQSSSEISPQQLSNQADPLAVQPILSPG